MIRLASLLLTAALASAADEVVIYMYSDYLYEEAASEFSAATGDTLRIETYENQDEALAKLQSGGAKEYDVIVVTDVLIPAMIRLRLVQPIDHAMVPNGKHISANLANPSYDPGNRYSFPYLWGTYGLFYSTKAVQGEPSWALLFDPAKVPGPFVMMDESRSMLAVALMYLGKSSNSTEPADLAAAAELLIRAKQHPKCLGFDGGVGALNKVLAGEAAVAVVYNGDAVRNMPADGSMAYAVPKEGSGLAIDCLVLSSGAPHATAGQRLINFLLEPKIAAKNASAMMYATPVERAKAMIDPAQLTNPAIYPPPTVKLESQIDLGEALKLYDETWTAIKAR